MGWLIHTVSQTVQAFPVHPAPRSTVYGSMPDCCSIKPDIVEPSVHKQTISSITTHVKYTCINEAL